MLASFLAGDGNPDEQTGDMPVSIRALLTLILPLPLLLLCLKLQIFKRLERPQSSVSEGVETAASTQSLAIVRQAPLA